jgi:hypothetical protein
VQEQFANEFAKINQRIGEQLVSIREEIDGKIADMQQDISKLNHESHDLREPGSTLTLMIHSESCFKKGTTKLFCQGRSLTGQSPNRGLSRPPGLEDQEKIEALRSKWYFFNTMIQMSVEFLLHREL